MFCVAIVASAGAATTKDLRVQIVPRFAGDTCPSEKVIYAVRDGEDGMPPLKLHWVKPCTWENEGGPTFSTTASFFSLRVGDRRTECHAATAEEKDDGSIAVLEFNCCVLPDAFVLTVETNPRGAVSYVRRVDAKIPGLPLHRHARGCDEEGILETDANKIRQVQFGMEKIELQIGFDEPDPKATGLSVKELPDAVKRGDQPLTFNDVVHRLNVQRARDGKLAPNAIDLDVLKLKEVKLESVTVRVSQ